jgi:hypothetical protein
MALVLGERWGCRLERQVMAEADEIQRQERAVNRQNMPRALLFGLGALVALAALLLFYSY